MIYCVLYNRSNDLFQVQSPPFIKITHIMMSCLNILSLIIIFSSVSFDTKTADFYRSLCPHILLTMLLVVFLIISKMQLIFIFLNHFDASFSLLMVIDTLQSSIVFLLLSNPTFDHILNVKLYRLHM